MKVLIIEDELPARDKLEAMLKSMQNDAVIVAKLGSVKESLQWLANNPTPDLAFVDIQLSDDHSFEIFRKYEVSFPVVFTTAFDKYVIESFEFNSIDYLLKPITMEKLQRALDKVKRLQQHFTSENLTNLVKAQKPSTLSRIVGKKGTDYVVLNTTDVAYFYTEHKIVFMKDFEGRQFMVDQNLSELESQLDSKIFFRINRKYIGNVKAIEKFRPDNGKIRIYLNPEMKEDIHVSKESAPHFREWISGEK